MDDVTDPLSLSTVPPVEGHLNRAQVLAALESLTDQDHARLDWLERRRLSGTDFAPGDLLHAAVCCAILETKKCGRNTSFVAFLAKSMQNIASRQRKKLSGHVPIQGGATREDADEEFELKDDTPGAEEQILRAENEKRATAVWTVLAPLYAPDEEISLVLLGWEESMRGKELREFVGVTQDRLDYLIKKIRRIAAKHYPTGWQL